MLGFITGLFGGSNNNADIASKAADGIYNGLDKLIYTDEEKADAMAQGRGVFLKFIEKAYDQNSIRSVTRRWLAFMVIGPTMLFFIAAAIFHGVGILPTEASVARDVAALLENKSYISPAIAYSEFLFKMAQVLTPWAGGVLVFYFGPHLIGAARK